MKSQKRVLKRKKNIIKPKKEDKYRYKQLNDNIKSLKNL